MGRSLLRFGFVVLAAMASMAFADGDDWVQHYYQHPSPERVVTEVRRWSVTGALSDGRSSAPLAVFLARVMAANPGRVDAWLAAFSDLRGVDRDALMLAAGLSRTPAAEAYLRRQRGGGDYLGAVDIRDLAPEHGTHLDMLWADFFATGDSVPVRRIVSALELERYSGGAERYGTSRKTPEDARAAELDAVFQAARWSLIANARQHPRVLDLLDRIFWRGRPSSSEKAWLAVVLAQSAPGRYELDLGTPGRASLRVRR